jgi:hypothetical protein
MEAAGDVGRKRCAEADGTSGRRPARGLGAHGEFMAWLCALGKKRKKI